MFSWLGCMLKKMKNLSIQKDIKVHFRGEEHDWKFRGENKCICSKHIVGARRMKIANISQRCLRLISEIYIFHLYHSVLCKRCSFTSKTESRTPSLIVFYFHQNLARIGRDKQEHGQSWFSFYSQLLACLGTVINNVYKTN